MFLMYFKRTLLILLFILFLLPKNLFAKEIPQVLFINQVRGNECCSAGTLINLKTQVNAFEEKQIPAFFVLRYDVLQNREYTDFLKQEINKFPKTIKLGLLIEVTPQLATDSKVKFNGNVDKWFEAQNAFTIGYKPEDRKKMIDQLLKSFKETFDYYPKLTSAWLIDTDTLNYLHDKYGIISHQITREQWGTDSYTLYGGPPHYPYPASRNWVFIPDFSNSDPIMMLRQTVTDPLLNYGEIKKAYTSQPNDYLSSGLDFSYFKNLVDQALFNQKTTGFILLGLENSMAFNYQEEFLKQIEYINGIKKQINFPDLISLSRYWTTQKITFYDGKDLISGSKKTVLFTTTPEYRERLIKNNNKKYVTDYRYYDKNYIDPYNDYIAKKNGYWVVPYAVDYSHVFKSDSVFPDTRTDANINYQPIYKIKKVSSKIFNETRFENYPYFLPEPIEREIDSNKSEIKININKKINLLIIAKDRYGYPNNMSFPVSIKTDPQIKDIVYRPNSNRHEFIIPETIGNILVIKIYSNNKVIKTILLFPKLVPFINIMW